MAQRSATDWVTLLGAAFAAYVASSYHLPWWEIGLVAGGAALVLGLLGLGISELRKRLGKTSLSPEVVDQDDDTFVIDDSNEHDTPSRAALTLDSNISYRPTPNHLSIHSQYDTLTGDREYEYRVTNVGVAIRLLECRSQDGGKQKEWDVRDGVVQEFDMRERWAVNKFKWDKVEENIEGLKNQIEWQPVTGMAWNGALYFILSKKLPKADARRFFRQELERLRKIASLFETEFAKLGYKLVDRNWKLEEGREAPTEEQWEQVRQFFAKQEISWHDFYDQQRIGKHIDTLSDLCADSPPKH